MKQGDSQVAKSFNRGSDDRLAGVPLQANPHPADDPDHDGWRRGWLDCHSVFGRDARWPVRPLPRV